MLNKVAVVTGAVKGIGLGIAEEFARQGSYVVIADLEKEECDKTAKEIEAKFKVMALGIKCDMASQKDVKNLVSQTVKKFGKLDIFVNNAGIYPFKPILEITEQDWDKVLDINLKGSFFSISEAAKAMQPGGKIVIISSIASLVGFSGLSHYCASKGGVNGLVRAAALELAAKKINVNAVAPGAIETPGATGAMDEKARQQTMAAIPWKRWGQPEDIAHAAVFLCSEKADYITGQVIVVDGGWTLQ
ncbi:TPA: SDR family oxidoreductase [Candidatus Woesearchaeota archaeon]|nr:3-oxoacyl-[acyl-carrier-protein] reductase FabG, short chain dehydrogenase SDR family [archaeon GW2011_AR15]MBS3104090.1 SDR family oxidoreductase [Candidatus Woesearchaeota archaeon]HIH41681.1 SDR family oxidoreductase [Candidatus Woesearchaeota archaeon]